MKNEKQIQEAVWKHFCVNMAGKTTYRELALAKPSVELIVTKTIELMETEYVALHHDRLCVKIRKEIEEEQQKNNIVGIIRHEPIDVDSYKCGYEAATKEIVEKNIVPDSTATILYQNGCEAGYAACVREIEEKLSKDNTISFDSWKQGWEDGCTEFARLMKEKTDDLYHKLEEREVWGISGDVVCNNCENLVAKLIDTLLKEMTEKKEGKE